MITNEQRWPDLWSTTVRSSSSAFRAAALSVLKSAMSSLCRFAGATIARFIAAVTKRLGGKRLALILPKLLAPFG